MQPGSSLRAWCRWRRRRRCRWCRPSSRTRPRRPRGRWRGSGYGCCECRSAWWWSSDVRWEVEHLTRVDQVGVLDGVPVRFIDRVPLVRIAELTLGDLGKAVAGDDRVGTAARGVSRGAGTAAADVAEVGLRGRGLDVGEVGGLAVLVVVLVVVEHLVEQSHGVPACESGS